MLINIERLSKQQKEQVYLTVYVIQVTQDVYL